MLHELKLARALWPGLDPSALWAMATTHGASAVVRPGLARLRVGAPAALVEVPAAPGESVTEIFDAVCSGARRPTPVILAAR